MRALMYELGHLLKFRDLPIVALIQDVLLLPMLLRDNFEVSVSILVLVCTTSMVSALIVSEDELIVQVIQIAPIEETSTKQKGIVSLDAGNRYLSIITVFKPNW